MRESFSLWINSVHILYMGRHVLQPTHSSVSTLLMWAARKNCGSSARDEGWSKWILVWGWAGGELMGKGLDSALMLFWMGADIGISLWENTHNVVESWSCVFSYNINSKFLWTEFSWASTRPIPLSVSLIWVEYGTTLTDCRPPSAIRCNQ